MCHDVLVTDINFYAFISLFTLSVCAVQVWLLLDMSGGVEEAQLINRRLLSLYSLWGHPTAGGAVQGDDCGGIDTHLKDHAQVFSNRNMHKKYIDTTHISTGENYAITCQMMHYWSTCWCVLQHFMCFHTQNTHTQAIWVKSSCFCYRQKRSTKVFRSWIVSCTIILASKTMNIVIR